MNKKAIALFSFLVLELLLAVLIVAKVNYTEIDWKAYMQEVEGFLNGELDYKNLRGDTGPLVYPAGFVYVYSLFYRITSNGADILKGQQIFVAIYLLFIATVLMLYNKVKNIPLWVVLLLCLSRRIHSIFLLRMFNDGIAMLFLYAAILFFVKNRWSIGCFLFSLAVSIKMNILLFAPGLLFLLIKRFGIIGTIPKPSICAIVQVVLGIPFLITFPVSYLSRAFELSRVFQHVWTVNLKFLPEELFQSKEVAILLLCCHLSCLVIFANWKWTQNGIFRFLRDGMSGSKQMDADTIIRILFESNFIGIVFARTLHFQFYVWYFHTLPFLLWVGCSKFDSLCSCAAERGRVVRWLCSNCPRLAILVCIEIMWNIFPSGPISSATLTLLHLFVLLNLWLSPSSRANQYLLKKNK